MSSLIPAESHQLGNLKAAACSRFKTDISINSCDPHHHGGHGGHIHQHHGHHQHYGHHQHHDQHNYYNIGEFDGSSIFTL